MSLGNGRLGFGVCLSSAERLEFFGEVVGKRHDCAAVERDYREIQRKQYRSRSRMQQPQLAAEHGQHQNYGDDVEEQSFDVEAEFCLEFLAEQRVYEHNRHLQHGYNREDIAYAREHEAEHYCRKRHEQCAAANDVDCAQAERFFERRVHRSRHGERENYREYHCPHRAVNHRAYCMEVYHLEAAEHERDYEVRDIEACERGERGERLYACAERRFYDVERLEADCNRGRSRSEQNYDSRDDVCDVIRVPDVAAEVVKEACLYSAVGFVVTDSLVAEIVGGFQHHVSEGVDGFGREVVLRVECRVRLVVGERREIHRRDFVVNIEIGSLGGCALNSRINRARVRFAGHACVSGGERSVAVHLAHDQKAHVARGVEIEREFYARIDVVERFELVGKGVRAQRALLFARCKHEHEVVFVRSCARGDFLDELNHVGDRRGVVRSSLAHGGRVVVRRHHDNVAVGQKIVFLVGVFGERVRAGNRDDYVHDGAVDVVIRVHRFGGACEYFRALQNHGGLGHAVLANIRRARVKSVAVWIVGRVVLDERTAAPHLQTDIVRGLRQRGRRNVGLRLVSAAVASNGRYVGVNRGASFFGKVCRGVGFHRAEHAEREKRYGEGDQHRIVNPLENLVHWLSYSCNVRQPRRRTMILPKYFTIEYGFFKTNTGDLRNF